MSKKAAKKAAKARAKADAKAKARLEKGLDPNPPPNPRQRLVPMMESKRAALAGTKRAAPEPDADAPPPDGDGAPTSLTLYPVLHWSEYTCLLSPPERA